MKGWRATVSCRLDCAIKNGTASCGYKNQPLSARQTKKSPWLYSLEVFQGIPPRIFLAVPQSEEVSLRYEDCLSATTADFYTKYTKGWEYANEIDHSKQEPLPHMFEWIEMEIAKNREEYGLMKTDLSKQKIEDKKS